MAKSRSTRQAEAFKMYGRTQTNTRRSFQETIQNLPSCTNVEPMRSHIELIDQILDPSVA